MFQVDGQDADEAEAGLSDGQYNMKSVFETDNVDHAQPEDQSDVEEECFDSQRMW